MGVHGYVHSMEGQDVTFLKMFDSVAEQAVAQSLDSIGVHFTLADLAYIRGDQAAYDRVMTQAAGTPDEFFMLFWKAMGQDARGHIKASRETWQKARSLAMQAGLKDFAAVLFGIEAQRDATHGYITDARQKVSQALALSTHPNPRGLAAEVLATVGDVARSKTILDELSREFPDNRYGQLVAAPLVQAMQRLQQNQPAEAIATLEPVRPYEFGTGPHGAGFDPIFIRGLAYLHLRDGAKAAAEFQRILDHQGVGANSDQYFLAHLNLGRAYVVAGDTAKAKTGYQDFFALWKDADPDIPILKQAKAEYARLQ
jgi:tetratricopeptide (TPR) repeat protein